MNRKITLAVAVVAVLAAGYPASSWYFGSQIEARVRHLTDEQVAALPFLKLVRHDYERGVFGAEETVVVEIPAPKAAKSGGAPTSAPLRLTAKSLIRHGPVLDSGVFGMASVISTIEFDEAIQKKVLEAFGGKPPLESRMSFDFGGGGHFTLASPKFSVVLPGSKDGETVTFLGDGLDISGDFTPHMERYTLRGGAPRFELQANDGTRVKFAGLGIEADQQRLFADEPMSYVGTQRLSLDALEIEPGQNLQDKPPKVALKNFRYDIQASPTGDFVDLVMRLGTASLVVGEQDYGPAAYDSSLKHLRARTLVTLNRKILEIYSQPDVLNDQRELLRILQPMKSEFIGLLLDGVVLSIDRIAFRLPDGEAKFTMSVRLVDARAEDFDNPLALVGKIDASADVALPSGLFKMLSQASSEEDDEDEGTDEEAQGFIDGVVTRLVQQDYATNDGGILKSRLVFKAGQLQLNDKPFNPMSFMLH